MCPRSFVLKSLSLRLTVSLRIRAERSGELLENRHIRRFQLISEAIRESQAQKKKRAVECTRVKDDIIRPAIREAGNQIKINGDLGLAFNDQHITAGNESNSLYFICKDGVFEVRTRINSEIPIVDRFLPEEISTELVVNKITNFFTLLYMIPPSALEDR